MKKLTAALALTAAGAAIMFAAVLLAQPGAHSDLGLRLVHDAYNASLPPDLQDAGGFVVRRGAAWLSCSPLNASFTAISWHLANNSSRAVYLENVTRPVGGLANSSLHNASGTPSYPDPFGLDGGYVVWDSAHRFRLVYHVEDLPPEGENEFFSITYRLEISPDLRVAYRDWYDYELYNFTGSEALAFSVQLRDGAGDLAFLLPLPTITDAEGDDHFYGYYYLKSDGDDLLVEALYFTDFMDAPPYDLNLDVTWNSVRLENATGAPLASMRQGEDAYLRIVGGFEGQAGEAHLLGPDGDLVHKRYVEDAVEEVVPLGLSGNFPPGNYTVELRELTVPGGKGRLLGNASVELLYRVLANLSLSDEDGRPRTFYLQGEPLVIHYDTSLPAPFAYVVVFDSMGGEAHRFEVNGAQQGTFTYPTSEYDPWGFWTVGIYDARPDFFGEGAVEQHLMASVRFYLEPLNRESHAWVDGGPSFTQGDAVSIGYHYYFDLRSQDTPVPTARLLWPDGSLAREWYLSLTAGNLTYYTDRGTPTGDYTLQVVFTNSTGDRVQASTGFEVRQNLTPPPPSPPMPEWGQAHPPTRELRVAVVLVEDPKAPHATGQAELLETLGQGQRYFAEASYGHLVIDAAEADFLRGGAWKVLPQPMSAYAGTGDDARAHAYKMARDALDGLWTQPLSSYDAIVVVHAGWDQAVTLNETDVLSRAFTLTGTPAGDLNVVVVSESDPFGVWAHELAHSLGCIDGNGDVFCQLPDLYPGERDVGRWGLMGGVEGVFGTDPEGRSSPPQPCSWTKMRLGWLQPFFVGRDDVGRYTLPSLETNRYGGPVLVFDASDPNDDRNATFYIVEPRTANSTRTAFEGVLRNHGEEWLVVYKVTVDRVYATPGSARGLLSDRVSIRVVDSGGPDDAVLTATPGDDVYRDPSTGVSVRLVDVERNASGVWMTVELGLRPPDGL